MQTTWDIVVIGAGPAGLAAAIAAAGDGASCLCIDRLGPGGLLINLGALHDVPGLPESATGPDLVASLTDRAADAGVELAVGEVVRLSGGRAWTIETADETCQAHAVVIATGLSQGVLGVDGEAAFEGRGLSHCAACDGPLYVGQDVVVAGADRWAVQEAIELAGIARRVTLVHEGQGPAMADHANIDIVAGRITALQGDDGLSAVALATPDGERSLPASAVFAYTGRVPEVSLARALLDLDASGHIMADADFRTRAVSVFACGDVRAGAPQCIAAAMQDGARAGHAAARHVKAARQTESAG